MTELTSKKLNSELDSLGAGGSNSPLYVQKLNPEEFRKTLAMKYGYLHTKIDRLTITGYPNEQLENDLFAEKIVLYDVVGLAEKSISPDGEFVSYTGQLYKPEFKENFFVSYTPIASAKLKNRPFRIEFNPAKVSYEHLNHVFNSIILRLTDVAISRLDLAFDFERDLTEVRCDWTVTKQEVYDRTGSLKTRYYGDIKSDLQVVLYDKKAERLAKADEQEQEEFKQYDTLWRAEYRFRNAGYISAQSRKKFADLEAHPLTIRNYSLLDGLGLSAQEKILLRASDDYPELFKELTKGTKAKYRAIRKDISDDNLADILRGTLEKTEICTGKPQIVNVMKFCDDILHYRNPLKSN